MASIKLSIAEPCHENWEAMLPDEKGRFCLSCQKTVVDFTAMNDRQVLDYFKNYNGNTCGQFSPDQLGRELTKPKTSGIGRWKYFWQILLPAVFAFQKLDAQPKLRGKVAATPVCKPETKKPPGVMMGMVAAPLQVQKTRYQIEGKLVNSDKEPIPFATVTSGDGKYAVADSMGKFKISLSEKARLIISQVGYIERSFTIDSLQTDNISGLKMENGLIVIETTIELKQSVTKTPEMIVTGCGPTGKLTSIEGGVSVTTKRTLFAKQKVVKPNTDLPQLKIAPNPIQPGQNFQITCQVQKTGDYILQVADAAGRIMIKEKLILLSKNQTKLIKGEALEQAGIYFLTLTNPADKKSKPMNGQIVVQQEN